MQNKVKTEISPHGILTITLNDPDHRNAMGNEMADEFRSAIEKVGSDSSVRSCILTGTGRAFAAGGDLQMLKAKSKLDRETNKQRMLDFYNSFLCIQELPFPTIAAVNGHAIGAGMCVAMACDFRVISTEAKLGFTFAKLGLHPGMGATLFLPRIAGQGVALDLLVSGRLFSADEALSMRMTQKIAPPEKVLEEANAIAESLLCTGPKAVASLLATLRPSNEDLKSALLREAEMQAEGYARKEFLEGVTAIIEKRDPQF